MKLPFLNRSQERERLLSLARRQEGSFGLVYGRRRCGKSRLLLESFPEIETVYHLADEREPALQRLALAESLSRLLPGFDRVVYPDWDSLLARWWQQAPVGCVLTIDEFPALVSRDPSLPSVIQRYVDFNAQGHHLIVCGSAQRLMQGLVLDRTAPLYGRATEILKVRPLLAGWIVEGLGCHGIDAIEAYAVWGGVPRYWELAKDYPDLTAAVKSLILAPLGVLHDEPTTLLLDDLRDSSQASSILQLVGLGCHRLSEIAARMSKPSGELGRPLQRLLELELLTKETPFGCSEKDSKRTLYRVADPFLSFWFRYVAPHRSWLAQDLVEPVWSKIQGDFTNHVANIWEVLCRQSVPHLKLWGQSWSPAKRWWGPGARRLPLEVDLVANTLEDTHVLVGSVKWQRQADFARWVQELQHQAQELTIVEGRTVHLAIFCQVNPKRTEKLLCQRAGVEVVTPDQVLSALR